MPRKRLLKDRRDAHKSTLQHRRATELVLVLTETQATVAVSVGLPLERAIDAVRVYAAFGPF